MNEELTPTSEMNAVQRITGIFTSPRETLESIDRKPTWLVPYLIVILLVIAQQLIIMDIAIEDRFTIMEAKGTPQEQIDAGREQVNSPFKYISIPFIPIVTLALWAIFAGIFLGAGNLIIGGNTTFKKMFSVVSWTSVIAILSTPLLTFLILNKGTSLGVGFDLSILLPAVPLGESKPFLHLLFARFDLFVIWQLVLWIIGLSVLYKTPVSKAATPIIILWVLYAAAAIAVTNLLSGLF